MHSKQSKSRVAAALIPALALAGCAIAPPSTGDGKANPAPLMLQEQGSFAVGGTVTRTPGVSDPTRPGPEGQTLHGDHARVFYQVPVMHASFHS